MILVPGPSQEIADLKAGRGMGLALVAELNGYPGPVHVLELAESLRLSVEQRARAQRLFEAMKAETIPLGEKLIAQEADLDRQFAGRTVTEPSLVTATQAIATTQAALRAAHLKSPCKHRGADAGASSALRRIAWLREWHSPRRQSSALI